MNVLPYQMDINTTNKHTTDAYPEIFEDIAPYTNSQYREGMTKLSNEAGFEHAMRFIMPEIDYEAFKATLLSVDNIDVFQKQIAGAFLEYLAKKTTGGVSYEGMEHVKDGKNYTFISNHRDIVLDASFLNLCFIRADKPITQIAIGNNLLIYEWIRDLVRINRCFIVKRDVKPLQALQAARQLSEYIHYVINQRHESVWIAQREGRAKDSNDVTQESLLKMLTLGCDSNSLEALKELNILPVSISYEYDPNDYLKVREFLLRRRDPDFKKSQHDDLFSMETGILSYKGKVHFTINPPINNQLDNCDSTSRNDVVRSARTLIDNEIHGGYKIYPINYVAFDLLNGVSKFSNHYDSETVIEVNEYFKKQSELIGIENLSDEEERFVHEMFLTMYANPLINKLDSE